MRFSRRRAYTFAETDNPSHATDSVIHAQTMPLRGLGTRIGLSVVKQIVDYAGGYVGVKTDVGEGTTFRVYLPRANFT